MLKTKLLHPEILAVLGSNGHGSRVLVADGNYPFATGEIRRFANILITIGVVKY